MLMRNRIRVHTEKEGLGLSLKTVRLMQGCAEVALLCEGMTIPSQIDITLTNDEGIREINRDQRGLDRVTDVLSFPTLAYVDGKGQPEDTDFDPDTGLLFLGDIVINVQRARQQAAEYGHDLRRECGFLTVHSVMHLLGYDHEDETRRRLMRAHEEQALSVMGLERAEVQEDFPGLAEFLRRQTGDDAGRGDRT